MPLACLFLASALLFLDNFSPINLDHISKAKSIEIYTPSTRNSQKVTYFPGQISDPENGIFYPENGNFYPENGLFVAPGTVIEKIHQHALGLLLNV